MCSLNSVIPLTLSFVPLQCSIHCWSVGPRRPSNQGDAIGWLPIYVTGWLRAGWLAIFACLFVGFRPRFQSAHHAPSEVSCLERQTTLRVITLNIRSDQWSPGNVQSRFRCPLNFSASVTHAHCILRSSRKTHIDRDDVHLQFAESNLA